MMRIPRGPIDLDLRMERSAWREAGGPPLVWYGFFYLVTNKEIYDPELTYALLQAIKRF